jgi:hypothetical protein
MGETELRQVRDEIEAILLANLDRCFWMTPTRVRYEELIRRETSLLRGRQLAIA